MSNINIELIKTNIQKISSANTLEELKQIHVNLLSKSGLIQQQFSYIKSIKSGNNKDAIKEIVELKNNAENALQNKKQSLEKKILLESIQKETIDTSLPGKRQVYGKIHPLSKIIQDIISILEPFGFKIIEGQNLENDWHNFSALNVPDYHPSRQSHDTFYINSKEKDKVLLRTHTSNVQIRSMLENKPPVRLISYGRTYRFDSDSTHTPMFHQIECVAIDKNITLSNMKFILLHLLKELFGEDTEIRFRPSYFPFTSPSYEIDARPPGKNSWLELLGCGMIHQNVLKNVNINSDNFQGFAFGIGIERLAMIKYNVSDIKHFFEGNMRWITNNGFVPNM